jgi:hypothetical protein
MAAIDDLKAKVTRLRYQLREAEAAYNAALVAESQYKIGDRYERTDRRAGVQRGEITNIKVPYGYPRPVLTLFKKDGTLGVRTSSMWQSGWKLIPKE